MRMEVCVKDQENGSGNFVSKNRERNKERENKKMEDVYQESMK